MSDLYEGVPNHPDMEIHGRVCTRAEGLVFDDLVRLFLQALDEWGCYFEGSLACSWLPHAMFTTNYMDDYAMALRFCFGNNVYE